MTRKVALLHTSFVFLEREPLIFELLEEMLPDVQLINIVEDKMLQEVMDRGLITPEVTRRMCYYVLAAEAMGVDAVFSTCSSLGPAVGVAKELVDIPIVRIDEGMAEKAAREGQRIGVLATVPTTLEPTIDLIVEKAEGIGNKVAVRKGLCRGAFELLMKGDVDHHDDMVLEKAKEVSQWADYLVLAQCSMARLATGLSRETGLPVLSSPRLGVERLRQVLEQLS